MDISSFATKASLIKGGVALSGFSSASIGGYHVYDWMNPWTKLKSLSFSGSFAPPKHQCFTTLSFDANLPTNMNFSNPTNFSNSSYSPTAPTDTNQSGSAQGCTIMKKTNKGDTDWEFESGTLIKDDKNGIFVSFELNSKKGNDSDNSRYQAYFFEKNNQKWETKFGFISSFGGNTDSKVTTPDGSSIKIDYDSSQDKLTHSGEYNYSGTWTENNSKSEKLLFDGVFKNLGNTGQFDNLSVGYIYDDGKIKRKSDSAITLDKNGLKKWFDLFSNKKGQWTTQSSS